MDAVPVGQLGLVKMLDLQVPPPAVQSLVWRGARRTERTGAGGREFYPSGYLPEDYPVGHLRFAFRHEPIDLGVIAAVMRAIEPAVVATWMRAEPTGGASRRAWFFFERFSGKRIDIPDVSTGNYVLALDPDRNVVADRRNSPRHRVVDNLLGVAGMSPTVRLTARLKALFEADVRGQAKALLSMADSGVLDRAIDYLYTKETRSSFEIEGESPGRQKIDRFVTALKKVASFDHADKSAFTALQNAVVDPRYAESDWRTDQVFIGDLRSDFREKVHCVFPRPADVPGLMSDWTAMTDRLEAATDLDPIVAAAVSAFALVFVHPFCDGNGRIHRFILQHVLAKRQFTPEGVLFPVSASILRDRKHYYDVLEQVSSTMMPFVDWRFAGKDRHIEVGNDTADLYRFFDATSLVEYLYERAIDTVTVDLKGEIGFLLCFDRALAGISAVVDMPDRRASLFVRMCMQNGGHLSKAKRGEFAELSDEEVAAMEEAVGQAMAAGG